MSGEYFPGALPPDVEEIITNIETQLWAAEQLADEDSKLSQRLKRSYEEGKAATDEGKPLRGWEELGGTSS